MNSPEAISVAISWVADTLFDGASRPYYPLQGRPVQAQRSSVVPNAGTAGIEDDFPAGCIARSYPEFEIGRIVDGSPARLSISWATFAGSQIIGIGCRDRDRRPHIQLNVV